MNNTELNNEIELRINPSNLSLSPGDIIDIMNQFDINEEEIIFAYNKVVEKMSEELKDTAKEVGNYFRKRGVYYPSFEEFKRIFNDYNEQSFTYDNIIRDMYKKEITDPNQMSLFEIKRIIRESIKNIREEDEFERDAAKITKQWGGIEEPEEEFSAEEYFGDAGDEAQADIEAEFGKDEFTPYGTMEEPRGRKDLNEEEGREERKRAFRRTQRGVRYRGRCACRAREQAGEPAGRGVDREDDGERA